MKRIKKLLCVFLTLLILVSSTIPVMANNNITVKIDGQQIEFDVPPQLINDRTMVPLRAIFEALGATVDWNNDTQTVTSTKGNTTISLTINNPTMYVNGADVALDSPACLVSGRTLVPVRAISEAFGTTVEWDGTTNTVLINTNSAFETLVELIKSKDSAPSLNKYYSYKIGSTELCHDSSYTIDGGLYANYTDSSYRLRLIFPKDGIISTYKLFKKNSSSNGWGDTVLTGSFENASIISNASTLPYDTNNGNADNDSQIAAYMLNNILSDLKAHLTGLSLSDLGFINYSGNASNVEKPQIVDTVTYGTTTVSSSTIKVYSTGCIRGEEANKIMAEASSTNDTPGRYKEWVILSFYIEYISSTSGNDSIEDFGLMVNNNLYAGDTFVGGHEFRGSLPNEYYHHAECSPGESVNYSIAVLVDKNSELKLKIPDKKNKTESWIVCDGSNKVENKTAIEYYAEGKAPTYTSITGVKLKEKSSYGNYYKYEYTSESDMLKYHQALFDRGFTVQKEDGDRIIFLKKSALGRHTVDIQIQKDGTEIWINPVSVYSYEID